MTRHELKEQLKHDHFTDVVSDLVGYTSSNRTLVIRCAIGVIILLAIAGGWYWYSSSHDAARQRDLRAAFAVAAKPVGPSRAGISTFSTQQAKTAAELKAFSKVAVKDAGTREGWMAKYMVGSLKAQQGDTKTAQSDLRAVVNSGSPVSPLARIALARIYAGENQSSEARVLLEQIVKNPNALVSKAQANILLAQLEMKNNPKHAKQLLQSLKTPDERAAVARAADQVASSQPR
ncbi:MAG: tetratricopeptide repeat protein [Bryobacteraceae bacterium]